MIINIRESNPGQILKKEVFDLNTGRIILATGTRLTDRHIDQLLEMNINFIEVEGSGEPETEVEAVYSMDDENAMTYEERLRDLSIQLCRELEMIFFDAKNNKKIVVSNVSQTLDKLLPLILKNDDIIQKLRIANLSDQNYTIRHSVHVCYYALMIGKWLRYDKIRIKQIALAALLHDIGKSKIPDHILDKPEKLTQQEYEVVKKHVIHGYNILKETAGIGKTICYGALQHHEREDGSGYPMGISNDQIHQFAKIIAICDVFDAMTSERVFQSKQSLFWVAEMIRRDSFGLLDPSISLLFLNNLSRFYVGNKIRLNDGREGKIVYINKTSPNRPVVKVENEYLDLSTSGNLSIEEIL